ncbi:MAG: cupin domain-containing protein [Anaerolineae bacterium]|nr:cupin domain-containing protein [Anaerolineae bacterium]
MKQFEAADLKRQQAVGSNRYLEFLREESLSMGLYVLPVGGVDTQQPHTEDEVYYVVSGRGRFTSGGEDHAVQAGSIIYVAAHAEHHFHSIEEELQILVFFAPAEYSQQGQ